MTNCSPLVDPEVHNSTLLPLLEQKEPFQVLQLSLLYAFLLPRRLLACLLSRAGRATGLPRRRSGQEQCPLLNPCGTPSWGGRLEREETGQRNEGNLGGGVWTTRLWHSVAPSLIRSPEAENLELESWFHTRMPKIRDHLGS